MKCLLSVMLAALLTVGVPVVAHAGLSEGKSDTCKVMTPLERPLLMSISYGKRINTGGNDNPGWFGRQKAAHNDLTIRMAYFVCHHWGIYGDLSFGGAPEWTPPVAGVEWTEFYQCTPFPELSVATSVGVMYRYESGRWQLFGRLGYGQIGLGNVSLDGLTDGMVRWEADRRVGSCYLDGGLSVGYRASRVISWLFDVHYRKPVCNRTSHVQIRQILYDDKGDGVMETTWRSTSRSWGENLTISIGIQLQCELSGSGKKKKDK